MLLSLLASSVLWTTVMLAVPPLPPEFPPNVPHRCVSDPMYRRLKKGRTSQQRISDPGFFDADHIPHGQLEGHLMMQQFTTSEELALFAEIRAFWQSYDLLKNRRRTRDWTAKTRQHCIKGYQEGMIAAREFPSSMAGDWGSGFRTASYGRELDMLVETLPWEFMAGLEAGTRNFASYPFGEQAAKAYGDCFGAAFEAKEMFMTDKHPESISRGALNGLVVADCVRGFEQKWKPPRSATSTLQQDGDWLIKCLDKVRRQCRKTPEEKAAKLDPGTKLIQQAEQWAVKAAAKSRKVTNVVEAAGRSVVQKATNFDWESVAVKPPFVEALKPRPGWRPVIP